MAESLSYPPIMDQLGPLSLVAGGDTITSINRDLSRLSLQEVTLFNKFPMEVQRMIWEAAFPEVGKIITINEKLVAEGSVPNSIPVPVWRGRPRSNMDIGFRLSVTSPAVFPATLHVCSLSREIADKAFTRAFQAQIGHPLLINFEEDILYLTSVEAMDVFQMCSRHSGISQQHLDSVKRVALPYAANTTYFGNATVLATFPKLTELYMVMPTAQFERISQEPDHGTKFPFFKIKSMVSFCLQEMGIPREDWTAPSFYYIDLQGLKALHSKKASPVLIEYGSKAYHLLMSSF